MSTDMTMNNLAPDQVTAAIEAAVRQVPPVWPLASFVAVNPYLGQTSQTLAETATRVMPRRCLRP